MIAGGGSFLGAYIAQALLAEGAAVSLLVQPGAEDKLGALSRQTRWARADVWSPGSLRGKARNHDCVIHSLGSLTADAAQGATYERLNVAAARNIANMCVSDGVASLIFISGARAIWHQRGYIQSKRAAERHLLRSGLKTTIVRAPLLYARDDQRPLFFRLMTRMGALPVVNRLGIGHAAPMAIETFARGVAQLALNPQPQLNTIVHARDLRRLARGASSSALQPIAASNPASDAVAVDEELPFGWTPGDAPR